MKSEIETSGLIDIEILYDIWKDIQDGDSHASGNLHGFYILSPTHNDDFNDEIKLLWEISEFQYQV